MPIPFFVPTCLSTQVVPLLVKQGLPSANKYKEHLKPKVVAPTELQQQLDAAREKFAKMAKLPSCDSCELTYREFFQRTKPCLLKQFFCKCLSNGSVRNATWVFGT